MADDMHRLADLLDPPAAQEWFMPDGPVVEAGRRLQRILGHRIDTGDRAWLAQQRGGRL